MIAQAKITAAEIEPSKLNPGKEFLQLTFYLKESLPWGEVAVDEVYTTLSNDPDWKLSYRRAELRWALDLKPYHYAKTIVMGTLRLIVPVFTKEDLPNLIGREVTLQIEEEPDTPWGPRLRVTHILPKEALEL